MTWLKDNDSVTLAALTPTGLSLRNVNRHSGSSGGGTGVIFRDSFKVCGVDGTLRESFEASEWNFTAHGKTTKFIVVYRPPYSEAHPVTPCVFFREFALYLENVVLCPEILIIAGDFNFHMDDPSDADVKKLNDLLETFGLSQHVTFATHVSGLWLDLIITRATNDIMVCSPRPSLFLSDYCFAECALSIPSPSLTVKEVAFRRWKQIDISAFKKNILASELYSLPSNEIAANYDRILHAMRDKHAPLQRKVTVVRPRVPWYSSELKLLKAKLRRLERKIRRSNLPSAIQEYKRVCKKYCAMLKCAKTDHYSDLIEERAGDSKKLFCVEN